MRSLILVVCLLFTSIVHGQSGFADYLSVGSSITYMNFNEDEIQNKEITWAVNLGVPITQRILLGLNYLNITTRIKNSISNENYNKDYFVVGAFVQYDFLKNYKSRLFGEAGVYTGNYCTCDEISGFQKDDLFYYNWGAGVNWHLYRGLFLDISFNAYYIINDVFLKFAYTQYVVGLDYHFGG